jgi:hypothetical protein
MPAAGRPPPPFIGQGEAAYMPHGVFHSTVILVESASWSLIVLVIVTNTICGI